MNGGSYTFMLRWTLLLAILLSGCQKVEEQSAPPPQSPKQSAPDPSKSPKTATKVPPAVDMQAAMRRMRMLDLTSPPATWGFKKDKEFPKVYDVLVDQPLETYTTTLISMRDGTASYYTTSSFGVIGGGEHPAVHDAAINLVKAADKLWERAKPTKNFGYPTEDQVHFFLLGYDGVRVIDGKATELEAGKGDSEFFFTAEKVITQIRWAAGGKKPNE